MSQLSTCGAERVSCQLLLQMRPRRVLLRAGAVATAVLWMSWRCDDCATSLRAAFSSAQGLLTQQC